MSESPPCPKCNADFSYPNGVLMVCPMCFHEWNPAELVSSSETEISDNGVKDANGNILQNGDTVIVIKDLPVKGASKSVKSGTKVKNIRLCEGDHNIDCKIDGFGAIGLKSQFVKKV